jgi:hypothetical protein
MIKELGFEFVTMVLFELKFDQKKIPVEDQKQKENEENQESKDEKINEEN